MAVLTWDGSGQKQFETGVDQGVLYLLNTGNGLYDTGYAWNGLTQVQESPAGATANPQYADNAQYLNLLSAETFSGQIDAFTYPDQFGACDGSYEPETGVNVYQQSRATFGLSYRTRVGNDSASIAGYKYHLLYGLREREQQPISDHFQLEGRQHAGSRQRSLADVSDHDRLDQG